MWASAKKLAWARAGIVAAGIIFGQAVLYGPSLLGKTVLLPVDLLAQPRWYLPRTAETARIIPHSVVLSDQVLVFEVQRQFAAREIRAGRWPKWNPHNFTGVPLVDSYSPFRLISFLLPAPIWLAWIQLLKSLVAGLGAYAFFRRVVRADFRPAAIGGICYPLTGFFILWQGYHLSSAAAWFPWILLATDQAIRRPRGWGGPALAALSGVVLSSAIGFAGQILLASAVFALWCLIDEYGWPPGRPALRPLAAAAGAWTLGLLLAMAYLLPAGEYMMTGVRAAQRAGGAEERPPVGLAALPQTVLPDIYGSWHRGSFRIVGGNRLSSSAAAYTGFVATLLLAPLALCSRRHRSQNVFWLVFGFLGLAWVLAVPGLVQVLRLPGLNMLSHNRSVFATSFAILSLAVIGLGWIDRGAIRPRRWFWLAIVVLALIAAWGLYRSTHLPEPLASQLPGMLEAGRPVLNIPDGAALERVRETFMANYRKAAALAVLTCSFWLVLGREPRPRPWLVPLLGVVLVADLLGFAYGLAPQCDPGLDYPEISVLERLEGAPPGRILGVDCLPPGLNRRFGLRDVRGYDAVDPARVVELLEIARDPASPTPGYGRLLWWRPRWVDLRPDGARLSPILDLLGVRYLIFRGSPPAATKPLLSGDDYWVVENPRALPRAFVPRQVRTAENGAQRLELLADDDFDPREVAYVEARVDLPEDSRGKATIVGEIPTRITVDLDMQTPGLVVLSDQWHAGWKARIDGKPAAILRTNHALRGVIAPAGPAQLVFSYEPASLALGIRLMLAALFGLLVWAALVLRSGSAVSGD